MLGEEIKNSRSSIARCRQVVSGGVVGVVGPLQSHRHPRTQPQSVSNAASFCSSFMRKKRKNERKRDVVAKLKKFYILNYYTFSFIVGVTAGAQAIAALIYHSSVWSFACAKTFNYVPRFLIGRRRRMPHRTSRDEISRVHLHTRYYLDWHILLQFV